MLIKSGQEALYVAIEMERGAIQTYKRALLMLSETDDPAVKPLLQQLKIILNDEHQHLDQFQMLYRGLDTAVEQQLVLSAVASSVLFEGGLMAAVRQGMLKDRASLLEFATNAEKKAIETYRTFAQTCGDPSAEAVLNTIADEEEKHLHVLRNYR